LCEGEREKVMAPPTRMLPHAGQSLTGSAPTLEEISDVVQVVVGRK
jgi:hypothetical protein